MLYSTITPKCLHVLSRTRVSFDSAILFLIVFLLFPIVHYNIEEPHERRQGRRTGMKCTIRAFQLSYGDAFLRFVLNRVFFFWGVFFEDDLERDSR